jgi:AcrR family transcriptional regulator
MKRTNAPPGRKGRTRGRPRDFNTTAALEQALCLFWEKGYPSTSINALTDAMGITPPSLYAAFGNKENLFKMALNLYATKYAVDLEKTLAEKVDPKEAFRHLLKTLADAYASKKMPSGCLVIFTSTIRAETTRDIERELLIMRTGLETALTNKIRQALKDKKIPPNTNVGDLAKFYTTFIKGMSTQARHGASVEDLEESAEIAMKAWPA